MLIEENPVDHPLLTSEEDLHGIDDFELEVGRRIERWNPNSFLRSTCTENDGVPEDVLGEHLGVPTFSQRLRDALADARVAEDDIQYLPVRVFQSTGEEIMGFAFANVVARVPALDYEASVMLDQDESEIDPLTGKLDVLSVWREALKSHEIVGHDVIRLVEFFPPVFVSERFAKVFRQGRFTGATLNPVTVT
jgi:hypothetical protein